MKKSSLPLILSLSVAVFLVCTSNAAGSGTTTAGFLEISPDARAVAMGESVVAMTDETSSLYWNPAGLGLSENPSLLLSHLSYIEDTNLDFAAYSHPVGRSGTWALGGTLLNSAGIAQTTEDSDGYYSRKTGEFNVQNMALMAGWGKRFNRISVGAAVKSLNQKIAGEKDGGFASDLGIVYLPWKSVAFGLATQNLGSKLNGDDLPMTVRGGAGFLVKDVRFSAETDLVKDNDVQFGAGVEWWVNSFLALRAGYRSGVDVEKASGIRGGLGTRWNRLELDYAFAPYGDLGDAHRVSLSIRFGKTRENRKEKLLKDILRKKSGPL